MQAAVGEMALEAVGAEREEKMTGLPVRGERDVADAGEEAVAAGRENDATGGGEEEVVAAGGENDATGGGEEEVVAAGRERATDRVGEEEVVSV